jgi:predicted kinase
MAICVLRGVMGVTKAVAMAVVRMVGAMRIRIEPGAKTLERVMRGLQLDSEGVMTAAVAMM